MEANVASGVLALPAPSGQVQFADKWCRLAAFLIVGYLCMSRSFAYLGMPRLSIYIGEIVLAAFLLFGPRTRHGRWLWLTLSARRLKRFKWLLLVLLAYGGFEAMRGVLAGYPAFVAARDTAFNYYPVFLFLGIWAGLEDRELLRRVVRGLAWWNGCYGAAWVLFLSGLPWTVPGTTSAASTVPLFGQPAGSVLALLGLISFEPRLWRVWHLIVLNAFVLLGVQVRAEWVGFALGLLVFAWSTKRIRRLAVAGGFIVALLAVMYVAKINIPSPEGRGGEISFDSIIARGLAPINTELAYDFAGKQDASDFAATAAWRTLWWASIWQELHGRFSRALFGFGYGYPIGDLNPLIEAGEFIQTPHSDFFYALAYSGWIGVALFALLQLELGRLLLRAYRATGEPFGLMCWSAMVGASLFEGIFESPFGAIPFYLLVGLALAPGLLARKVARPSVIPLGVTPRVSTADVG